MCFSIIILHVARITGSLLCKLTARVAIGVEQRIHDMETELGSVQAHTNETAKQLQKAERRSKELAFTIDEDKKNQDRMSDLAGKLQAKVKTYKRQIEDAEEIAALNLAKFRKAQQELEEVEERTRVSKLH